MRKIRSFFDNIVNKKNLGATQTYWKTLPEAQLLTYINEDEKPQLKHRSIYLVNLLLNYTNENDSILEIGCNAGRNLKHLYEAGYNQLTGLDINPDAIKLMGSLYPDMVDNIQVILGSIEDCIKEIPDNTFDTIYTMAVLQHIHYDSNWIFQEITRICKNTLILIESEANDSWNHYPRDYSKIFKDLGLVQVFTGKPKGLGNGFVAQVFTNTVESEADFMKNDYLYEASAVENQQN